MQLCWLEGLVREALVNSKVTSSKSEAGANAPILEVLRKFDDKCDNKCKYR